MQLNNSEDFVELMTSYQGRLYGYILSLLGDPNVANDVLQETNLVLWRKSSEFQSGTNFKAWSFRVASFQVMAHRQRSIRDRLVFGDALMQDMLDDASQMDDQYEARQHKLNICMDKLPDRQKDLVERRYSFGTSVKKIALDLKSTANSITQALFRARNNLTECVKSLPGNINE